MAGVAERFPEDKFETYILLAKFSDFSAEEIHLIKKFQGEYRNRIIMWATRELEPYEVYDEVKDKYVFERYNKRLDGLAQATQRIYLDPVLTPAK